MRVSANAFELLPSHEIGVEEKKKALQHMYEEKMIPEEVYNKKLAEITDSLGPGTLLAGFLFLLHVHF